MNKLIFSISLLLITIPSFLFAKGENVYNTINSVRCQSNINKFRVVFDIYRSHTGLGLRYSVGDSQGIIKAEFFVSKANYERKNNKLIIIAKDIDLSHYKDREKIKLSIDISRLEENGTVYFYEGKSRINSYAVTCRASRPVKKRAAAYKSVLYKPKINGSRA